MKPTPPWLFLAIMLTSVPAYSEEFKCLEGANNPAPYKPGNVVQWCEIAKQGRPVYHGSVWRWYPSGQMSGKEFYVFGDAEGEWPSWYENGNPSSLGTFKGGRKTGLWKYWDRAGWLKTEVTYAETGNLWTQYYPTGTKKVTGKTVQTGKIGLWTYWDTNGNEQAKCDFGYGLFALPSKSCLYIANELEPKGFSQPVPIATSGQGSESVLTVSTQSFVFNTPKGWVADYLAGKREQAPLVFYPAGNSWRDSGPNIYIRVLYKNGATLDSIVTREAENFQQDVAEFVQKTMTRGKIAGGRPTLSKTISYKPLIQTDSPFAIVSENTVHEEISFLEMSDQVVLIVTLTCHSEKQLMDSAEVLKALVTSVRSRTDTRKPV